MKRLNLLFLSLFYLASCGESFVNSTNTKEQSSIVEIGPRELLSTEFPKRWNTSYFEGQDPMTSSDSINQRNFENLSSYFYNLDGTIITDAGKYKALPVDKNESLDSIRLCKAYLYKDSRIEYVQVYKTNNAQGFDAPPKIYTLEVLRFNKDAIAKRITVYSEINYLFAVETKMGYLDQKGRLTTKEFDIDESGIDYKGGTVKDCGGFFN